MSEQSVSKTVEILNPEGMHARPADLFAKCAARFQSSISVSKAGSDPTDAKSILSLLTLAASKGTKLTIEATGADAEQAVQALSELVSAEFDASQLDGSTT